MLPSRIVIIKLCACVLLLFAGCGGQGPDPVNLPAHEQAQPAAVLAEGLPFPDEDELEIRPLIPQREVSGQTIYHAFPVDKPVSASQGVQLQSGLAQIYAGEGELAYALYRVPYAGAKIRDLMLSLSAAGPQCWLAMADYSRGAWSFQRADALDDQSISLSEPRWHSPKGNVFFAMIAADGSQIDLDNYRSELHYGDVIAHEVAQIGSHESLSIITLDGRPGIFYCDAADNTLKFSHASSSRPSFAEDWTTSVVDGSGMPGIMQSAAVWQGRALIAYTKQESSELWLAWSEDSSPAADSDWQHSMLLGGERINQHVSLEVVSDQPALACFRGDPLDSDQDSVFGYVHFMQHSGSDPAAGWEGYWLSAGGFLSSEPSLAEINGRPSIAFVNSGSGKLFYAAAKSASPQSPSDWQIHPTDISSLAGRLRLAEAGGVPILLYPRPDGIAGYLYGLTAEPQQGSDWMEWNSHCSLIGTGACFDLVSIEGRPELLIADHWEFSDGQGGIDFSQATRLFRAQSQQLSQTASDYLILDFGNSDGFGYGYCGTELEGQPAVAFVDSDGGRLIFARLIY